MPIRILRVAICLSFFTSKRNDSVTKRNATSWYPVYRDGIIENQDAESGSRASGYGP